MEVIEHADQRKTIHEVAAVLVFHQLAEQFARSLYLRGREMRLSADNQHHVFDRRIVELFLRRGVDGLGQIDAGDDGADVLFDFGDLQRLCGCLHGVLYYGAHGLSPWNVGKAINGIPLCDE